MTPPRGSRPRAIAKVDEIDEAIIGLLQEDGRRTYQDVAESVGLSEAATRQRVNRLRDSGTLRIVAVTDPIALGLRTVAMVGIKVSGDVRRVASRIADSVPAIEYVVISSGSFDILVEVICEDERQLLDIIMDEIRSVEDVISTESFIYLHIEKQVFAWGGRTNRSGSAEEPPSSASDGNRGARSKGAKRA